MSTSLRLLLPMLAVLLLAAASPRIATAQSATLTAADCAASPYDLDCGCATERFTRIAAELTPQQRPVALRMARNMIGIPGNGTTQDEVPVLIEIMPALLPLMDLQQTCKPKGGGAEPLAAAAREDIRALCERSRHFVDCDCIGFHYAKAANTISPAGQDMARALLGMQLNVTTSPTLEQIPTAIMTQYISLMDDLGGAARNCAIPTQTATAAWRNAARMPSTAPTLEARASASAAESLHLWCRSGGKSAARCACEVQVQRDLMPERTFRFNGESMKAQALVELGRLDGPQRFVHAARAMGAGADEVKALHADTATALEGMSVIASNVCDAVQAQAQATDEG